MILSDNIDRWGYAEVLVCDIHKEYPLPAPAVVIWDPDAMRSFLDQVGQNMTDAPIHRFADAMFKGRVEDFEDWASIWLIRGDLNVIRKVFDEFSQELMGGPKGADDDTFDYWPNAFNMLIQLAKALIILYRNHSLDPHVIIETINNVIQSAITANGPLEEWEADELPRALHDLRQLDKERTTA